MSSSTLALLAPPFIDTLLFWDEYKVGRRRYVVKNAVIFVVGFAGFATGTALSLKKIIDYFATGK